MTSSTPDAPNQVHDLGGRPGLGPVPRDPDAAEPFAEPWEGRAFAVTQMAQGLGGFNIDAFRHGIERESTEDYLRLTYWAKWTRNAERMLVEGGVIGSDAIDARLAGRQPKDEPRRTTDAEPPQRRGSRLDPTGDPRFSAGDRVTIGERPSSGHTRMPTYIEGRTGTVLAERGGWINPDSHAHGKGEDPQWVYTVAFDAAALWPEEPDGEAPNHRVLVDCFEQYLVAP